MFQLNSWIPLRSISSKWAAECLKSGGLMTTETAREEHTY